MAVKKGLGRGLSALIKDGTTEKKPAPAGKSSTPQAASKVAIDKIKRNKFQPRKHFDSRQCFPI